MEENFQYTNKFLRDNKDFILSLLGRDISDDEMSDWDDEKIKAAYFTRYLEAVFNAIFMAIRILTDSRLKRTTVESYLLSFLNSFGCLYVQKLLQKTDLLDFVRKFITVDVLKKYITSLINNHPEYSQLNKQILLILQNKGNTYTNSISPYKLLVYWIFWQWFLLQSNEEEYEAFDGEAKMHYYALKFKSSSWFACFENAVKADYTNEQYYQIFDDIIADYTKISNTEAKDVLFDCLLIFSLILDSFIKQDLDLVETDDRENIFGICTPKEKTKEERRIEVAANYLVKNNYIAENNKDLFVNIMNNRCPSGKIQFSHGEVNGKKKKKGGMNVLYGIIRFIREENFNPDVKEGKRQYIPDYPNDCRHFNFDNDPINETIEHKWKRIKDNGRKNESLSKLINELNKELNKRL